MEEIFDGLKVRYELQSLISSGIAVTYDVISPVLVDPDKILIPYLNNAGDAYFIKCHKKGNLPGIGIQPYSHLTYHTHYDKVNPRMAGAIILCESEFKAAALWQMGFRAVGLNGVNAFSGKNLPLLEQVVEQSRYLYILFDTEIQDDPTIPDTFKESPAGRYAHRIWAYEMAIRMQRYFIHKYPDFQIRIATLPTKWIPKGEGKIDCDSALAMGINPDQMTLCISDAVDSEAFRRQLRNEINSSDMVAVDRRLQSAHHISSVFEVHNCYFKRTVKPMGRGKSQETETVDTEISNFSLKLMNVIVSSDTVYREVRVQSSYANSDCVLVFEGEDFSRIDKFKRKITSAGDYVFKGSQADLDELLHQLSLEHPGTVTRAVNTIGRSDEHKFWMFKNVLIKDNEEVIEWNPATGSFDDKMSRTQWRLLNSNGSSEPMPDLKLKSDITARQVFDKMAIAWGREVAMSTFSFALSCLFSNDVYAKTQGFPMAFLFGERAAGKTALSDIMVALLGMSNALSPMNLSVSTENGIAYKLSYYNSLPVRMDEYREDNFLKKKQNMLRSLYNRQIGVKATRVAYKTIEYKMNGCVIMIGEEYPSDAALFSRCIPIHVKGKKTATTAEAVSWLYERMDELSFIAFEILKKYKDNTKIFMKKMEESKTELQAEVSGGFNPRALNHISMQAAMFELVFKDDPDLLKNAAHQFLGLYKENISQQQSSSTIYQFFEDTALMMIMEPTVKTCGVLFKDFGRNYAILNFRLLHQKWRDRMDKSNVISLASFSTLTNYMKAQPYCLSTDYEAATPASDVTGKCVVIDMDDSSIPPPLFKLLDSFEERTYGVIKDDREWQKIIKKQSA